MPTTRKHDRLTEEERQKAIQELIAFFEVERDEKIGVIAADQLLDHMLLSVGATLYNKGIAAAKNALHTRLEELNYDLDDLMDV
ncbi:MAG: DUF2164 family protein [Flavobacteriales bacterium]|nr:DUF2164 family protein [Flavobacteriales bacterium]